MRDWQTFVRRRLRLDDLTPGRERRIVREVATQLEDFYRDAVARGASEAEADTHARAQITDWTRLAADVRRVNPAYVRPRIDRLADRVEARSAPGRGGGLLMLVHALRDARYAIRQLSKVPGFTFVAVLTLALGIGATTAIFSVVNGVLLRPLPYPDSGALVRVHEVLPQYGLSSVAPASFLDWRTQNRVFERVAAYTNMSGTFVGTDGPERIQGTLVSWDLFPLLGVAPLRGAGFSADEDKPGAGVAIMLSYGLWQRRFGGDPGVIGRSITLSGAPATIVGVMPSNFYFPSRVAEFWQPLALDPANATRGGHFLGVVARRKSGVAIEQARAEMKAIAERLAVQYPDSSANESAQVVVLQEQIVGAIRPALVTLLAAVGLVVLIACANVANLLLVRASAREKEIAIRSALGADRRRLVLQMLAESLVLALAGGALGLLLGWIAIAPLQTLSAGSIPRVADVTIDGRVLAFAAAASLLTGILFGLAPAWQAARASVGAVLKEGGRASSTSGTRWVRRGLLIAEVALSIVLLTGATLLLRSFAKLTNVDPGFKPDQVLAFQVSLPAVSYAKDPQRLAFFDALLQKLEAQPSVQSTGLVQTLPLRGSYVLSFDVRGRAPAKPGEGPSANYRVISQHYFDALSIPLARGRTFTSQDSAAGQKVAVVDRAFARQYFANVDPIGQGLHIGNGTAGVFDIVGVVGDVHYSGLDVTAEPTMYVPAAQDVFSTMWVLARPKGEPGPLAGAARQTVHDLNPSLPIYSVSPLSTVISDSVAPRRFSMLLLMLFAVVALFLATVGLYGVVAYGVSQRTREIGLRMAIGAQPGHVLRLIVGDGMTLALIGVVTGVTASVILARLLRTMLFEVAPTDLASYALTAGVLLVVAALACYLPARRAIRVDPLVALHGE